MGFTAQVRRSALYIMVFYFSMRGQLAKVEELNTNIYIGDLIRDSPGGGTVDWYWLGETLANIKNLINQN